MVKKSKKRIPSWLKVLIAILITLFTFALYDLLQSFFDYDAFLIMVITSISLVLIGVVYGIRRILKQIKERLV